MRWDDFRRSDNVEDRTGSDGGGGGGCPLGGGVRLGGGALVVVVIASLIFGVNPLEMIGMIEGSGPVTSSQPPSQPQPGYGPQHAPAPAPGQPRSPSAQKDSTKDHVAAVLGDTEDVWRTVFQTMGARYEPPRLVLFHDATRPSACGRVSSATGPFYCSADRELYLDTAFFDELSRRFGAPGDFAQAYVIAHEVGHHVQDLVGIADYVGKIRQGGNQRDINATQVKMELQADCFAGVWGRVAGDKQTAAGLPVMEAGDLEEGLNAANAIGDDTLQRQSRGYVQPESFTHGTSEQRKAWLKKGYDTGDPAQCDTFSAANL